MSVDESITVVVPTSPIPSHPDTAIIEETVATVRHWLPDAELVVCVDGVRDEQADRGDDYREYTRRLLWLASHQWGRCLPIVAGEHLHQSGLLRLALAETRAPLMLFVEHDTPLTPDCDVPFGDLASAIVGGELNMVRLHHEAHLHWAEHGHLHVDREPIEIEGVPYVRTMQWSQRPHLASAAFYRHLLAAYFRPDARSMIEDRMYGVLCEALDREGPMAWPLFRLAVYHPEGGNLKRSYHLDGREGDPKWEDSFTW